MPQKIFATKPGRANRNTAARSTSATAVRDTSSTSPSQKISSAISSENTTAAPDTSTPLVKSNESLSAYAQSYEQPELMGGRPPSAAQAEQSSKGFPRVAPQSYSTARNSKRRSTPGTTSSPAKNISVPPSSPNTAPPPSSHPANISISTALAT